MNGLLDFLQQGYQDSGLQELGNSIANQPKMYDPHANARALMGSTPMQYDQQPQSLIAEQPQPQQMNPGIMTPPYQEPISPWGSAPQEGIIANENEANVAPVQAPVQPPMQAPVENPYNPAMIQPEISPWGSAPQEGMIGVDSKPPYSLLGDPIELEKKIREMEEAKLRLPWYLGGK